MYYVCNVKTPYVVCEFGDSQAIYKNREIADATCDLLKYLYPSETFVVREKNDANDTKEKPKIPKAIYDLLIFCGIIEISLFIIMFTILLS